MLVNELLWRQKTGISANGYCGTVLDFIVKRREGTGLRKPRTLIESVIVSQGFAFRGMGLLS